MIELFACSLFLVLGWAIFKAIVVYPRLVADRIWPRARGWGRLKPFVAFVIIDLALVFSFTELVFRLTTLEPAQLSARYSAMAAVGFTFIGILGYPFAAAGRGGKELRERFFGKDLVIPAPGKPQP